MQLRFRLAVRTTLATPVSSVDREPTPEEQGKDPAAVSLGRRGGLKGGKARAASMTPKRRAEIAKKAAETRWRKG